MSLGWLILQLSHSFTRQKVFSFPLLKDTEKVSIFHIHNFNDYQLGNALCHSVPHWLLYLKVNYG